MTFQGTPGVIELNASLFNIQQVPKNTILHEIPGKTKCKRIFPHCLKKKTFQTDFSFVMQICDISRRVLRKYCRWRN